MTKLLSTDALRRLALSHQGLATSSIFDEGLNGTRQAIEHLGYVQIDTISVVERAHHHILWNRVPHYKPSHLNQLVQQQHIFEYWYHAASYLPMQDYRYALPHMEMVRNGEHRYFNRGDAKLMNEILARVKDEGKIRLRDIEQKNKTNTGGWWNSSLARRSVEQLFMQGDLMISERHGMEKTFNLTERCIPNDLDLSMPTLDEYALYLLKTTLRAHGVFTWKQLIHLKTGNAIREAMRKNLNEQIEARIIRVVHHNDGETYYVNALALEQFEPVEAQVKILSPFDNLVIHRDRLSSLFKFDYRLECYVPAVKRVFGYFCLPILYGDQIVGRIDCKAHRAKKTLEVISLHLENHLFENKQLDREQFLSVLIIELHKFSAFNQCTEIDRQGAFILNTPF